jgi:hypothetical protein
MKIKKHVAILAVGILSALTTIPLGNSEKVLADSGNCTNATLQGNYVFEVSGFFGNQAPFSPAAAVRLVGFDGQGNFSGTGFSVLAGNVAQGNIVGTYQVQSNCAVQITFQLMNLNGIPSSTNNLFGVIVDKGKKIRTVNTGSTVGPATLLESFERVKD